MSPTGMCVRSSLLAAAVVGVGVASAMPTGCAELPEIADDVCGNSIIEEGEDCDSFTPSGLSCREVGAAGECRWDCTAAEDGTRPACPDGWGCGADGICRAHTGAFVQAGEPVAAVLMDGADFDGDHRMDLVTFDGSDLQVRFYEPDGSLAKSYGFSAAVFPTPSFGDLSGDGRSDAVIHLGLVGVGALTSTADRSMQPVVQASIEVPLPTDGSRLIAADVIDSLGDETMAILAGQVGFGVLALNQAENNGEPTLLFALPSGKDPRDLIGEIPSGDFDNDPAKPCPELVFGFADDSRVRVYTPCASASTFATQIQPRMVDLPAGHVIAGAIFVGDANADGHLDLIIPVTTSDRIPSVDVAFGLGDGSFHSDPAAFPDPGPGNDTAALVVDLFGGGVEASSVAAGPGGDPVRGKTSLLLAVGDLNGDQRVDLVTSSEMYLSATGPGTGVPQYQAQSLEVTKEWTVAAIADCNGNGHPDVVGGSSLLSGLDFLNGAGDGKFNPFDIPTQHPVHRLAVGDFDGDLLVDLAFAEVAGSDGLDTLAFSFGQPFGPPEDPVSAGTLRGIQQIITGDRLLKFLLGGGAPDAMSELAIVSISESGDSGSLTVVPGSSDRRLQSPYILFESIESAPSAPIATAIGQFTAADRFGDLVAIAQNIENGEVAAWLVTSTGDGKFDQARKHALQQDVGYFSTWFAVGDLDAPGDPAGLDEVVVLAPWYQDQDAQGLVVVMRPDGTGSFEAPEVTHVGPPLGSSFPIGAVGRLADLDGDGFKDLIARAALEFGYDPGIEDGETPAELYVFWNDAGQLKLDAPVALPTVEGEFLGAFATLNVDTDPEQEIVVVGAQSSWIVDGGAERTFTVSSTLAGMPGGGIAVGGDFNGDGVDDVAIGDSQSLFTTLWFGVPVRR